MINRLASSEELEGASAGRDLLEKASSKLDLHL